MISRTCFFLCLLGSSVISTIMMAKSDVSTPDQRRQSVDKAVTLTKPTSPAPLPGKLINPFILFRGEEKSDTPVKQIAGDRQVLTAAARTLAPSGVVQVGGNPMLLLGEKRLKVGDYLTITFEGNDYMIEIVAISRSSFTLRLNKDTVTQPINHY